MPVLVLLVLLAVAVLPRPCAALPITVDSAVDAPDAVAGDGLCATAEGACTLRAAIQETNALAGADTIILPAGTYRLTIAGAGEDAAATGDLDVTDDLEIAGAGVVTTVIDGNRLDRVLHGTGIPGSERALSLSAATVQGAEGIGILHAGGMLSLTDVAVRDSTGDGVRSDDMVADRLVVEDNGGTGIRGGAMQLVNAVARRNGGYGVETSAPSTVAASVIADNGGGAYNSARFAFPFAAATFDRCRITGNAGRGVENVGTLIILATSVTQNRGGGVRGHANSFVAVIGSTVSDNEADLGGGLHVGDSSGGAGAHLVSSTVTGNRAARDGGAIYSELGLVGGVILDHVTIVRNVADADADGLGTAGGVFTDPMSPLAGELVIMKSSILAQNTDANGERDCRGDIGSRGYNLIGTTSGCTVGGPGPGDLIGVDPALGPLADNGGPTQTHALLTGSPAIDGGEPGACTDVSGESLASDQRGVPRPQGDACDIGAVELACGNGVMDLGEACDDAAIAGMIDALCPGPTPAAAARRAPPR